MIRKLFIIGLIIALGLPAIQSNLLANSPAPDKAAFSGFVKDAKTKETLIGATIFILGTKLGARTNKNGYFSITNIPAGSYKIRVAFVGYDKIEKEFKFKENENKRIDFELNQIAIETEQVNVEAEREVEKRQISISKVNIPVAQIKELRVGGESDVFRSLQFLPGVLTSSQLSSGLYVRGGSPDQNLVLLDGATVYNPTHLFGFISTFNSEAIKDVELVKGGYEAQYGGRLSSVLNITQKDGNREKIEGNASIGVISSRLGLEGPLGNGSWFIGGRRTYFELVKGLLPDDPETPIPDFNFYDVNAKITQDIGSNDKLSFSGFLSQDKLDYESFGLDMGLTIGNKLAAMKWTHIFSPQLFATTNISASEYENNFSGDNSGFEFLINNSITDYSAKINLEWFTADYLTHKFGVEINNYKFSYLQDFTGNTDSTKSGSSAGSTNLDVVDWNTAVFAQANYLPFEEFSIQAGLRAAYWQLSDKFLLEPRLALRYQYNDDIAFKGAFGIYNQNLRLASQQDFSFFDTWLPTDSTVGVSSAYHYIFSVETRPFDNIDLNFDLYYKKYQNINELNTNALEGKNVDDVFFLGKGYSYGFEAFIQKKSGKFTGWAGYGLGFIYAQFDSINYGKEFRPKYDRRHDFKVVAQYAYDENWTFSASFTFQTGQSYTGATSRFTSKEFDQTYGRAKIIPTDRYAYRLPPSHQLNLNIGYAFKWFDLPAKVILDIYNVYNRRDIWFRYYNVREEETKVEDVRLIPILPTLSFEIKF